MKSTANSRRGWFFSKHRPVIDIGYSSLKLKLAGDGIELPIERAAGGDITPESTARLARELRTFLDGHRWTSRQALCGLPSRGISLRVLRLPEAPPDETARLMALQIEKELPLPPESIAWGMADAAVKNGEPRASGLRDVMVAAVRREILDPYAALLEQCGLKPTFCLGILAGSLICPSTDGRQAVLDVGRTHSQLLSLRDGRPESVRSLSWGGERVTARIAEALEIDLAAAEDLKRRWAGRPPIQSAVPVDARPVDARSVRIDEAVHGAAADLARLLEDVWTAGGGRSRGGNGSEEVAGAPKRLFLIGGGARLVGLGRALADALGGETECRSLEPEGGPGSSAATAGLERGTRQPDQGRLIPLRSPEMKNAPDGRPTAAPQARWIALVVLLAVVSVSLRYAGPFLRLPGLQARLNEMQKLRDSLPKIDRELSFLSHLDSRRGRHLGALTLIAESAPPGMFLEVLTMNRAEEISLRGNVGSREEAAGLRSKLLQSGWFREVVIEEQTPTKDQKRVEFRVTARLKPPGELPELPPAASVPNAQPKPPSQPGTQSPQPPQSELQPQSQPERQPQSQPQPERQPEPQRSPQPPPTPNRDPPPAPAAIEVKETSK